MRITGRSPRAEGADEASDGDPDGIVVVDDGYGEGHLTSQQDAGITLSAFALRRR
jgi:hypothetical protein